jgi:hypothetical protein
MKKNSIFLIPLLILIGLFACKNESEQKSEFKNDSTVVKLLPKAANSTTSLDSLTSVLIQVLKTKDKDLYVSYCFSEEQEKTTAQLITDNKKRKGFLREFGFSLHEEVAYFINIIKYIEKTGIDLNNIDKSTIEVLDYNKPNYAPAILKEVIIPILQDGFERDIVYVAVQIDGRWYFTSELSL